MRQIDHEEQNAIRNPKRPDSESGIAAPARNPAALFQGWGPKLMLCALAIGAAGFANEPAVAASQHVAIAACRTADHGASLISNPAAELPMDVSVRGTTLMRIDLSPLGDIGALAIAQSAGDPRLDIEAVRVARASHFDAASRNCSPVRDSVMYAVTFSE